MSIVATDAQGPTIIRLNEGLALRRPDGFRFVCPARWGDDAVVPMQAIPGGPAVIGASGGLYLMHADGTLLPHPAPEAKGRVLALAATPGTVLALRAAEQRELLEVRAETVRVLWRDSEPWEDLAVGPDFVSLARVSDRRVNLLRLSLGGDALAEFSAPLSNAFANVRLRALGSDLYTVLITSSLTFQLGRVAPESWFTLATAQNIAGPIEVAAGARFAAVDGVLARLDAERVVALDETSTISCLGRVGELSYACGEVGVRRLEASGLGSSLFELSALREPDLTSVPEAERATCMLQWQRYTVDLLRAGIQPGSLDAGVADASTTNAQDAGVATAPVDGSATRANEEAEVAAAAPAEPQPEPSAEPTDESSLDDEAEPRNDAEATPEPESESEMIAPAATERAQGCSCQVNQPRTRTRATTLLLAPLALLALRRRRGVALCRSARR